MHLKNSVTLLWATFVGLGLFPLPALSQTDGSTGLRATLHDYNGSGTRHWTVVWIESDSGTFIKTLWRQGPSIGSSHWNSHCREWYNSKNGSTAFDGYSSSTASNYSPPNNSPVILTWDCRDAGNNLVADGDYRFWIQYAEDNGQGPYTTSGLRWTKGPAADNSDYPNQGSNFSSMSVSWVPVDPPTEAPVITSAAPTATATVGVPYQFTSTATGTAPIAFSATGLPTGLDMSAAGAITGIPTATGTFGGTITAANGTPPDDTQAYSIEVGSVPVYLVTLQGGGNNLVLSGSGPAHGVYSLLATTNLAAELAQWTVLGTNTFDDSGGFSITHTPDPNLLQQFYLLRVP